MKYVCRAMLLEIIAANWRIFPRNQGKGFFFFKKKKLHHIHSFQKTSFKNCMTVCYFGKRFFKEKSWSADRQGIFNFQHLQNSCLPGAHNAPKLYLASVSLSPIRCRQHKLRLQHMRSIESLNKKD